MEKKPRPDVVPGVSVKVHTGCGNMYVTMTTVDDKPFEVFAALGKAGSCAKCQMEAICRAVSVGLRCGMPVEEYIKQLQHIRCPQPVPFPKEKSSLSCADGLARVMEEHWLGKAKKDKHTG